MTIGFNAGMPVPGLQMEFGMPIRGKKKPEPERDPNLLTNAEFRAAVNEQKNSRSEGTSDFFDRTTPDIVDINQRAREISRAIHGNDGKARQYTKQAREELQELMDNGIEPANLLDVHDISRNISQVKKGTRQGYTEYTHDVRKRLED